MTEPTPPLLPTSRIERIGGPDLLPSERKFLQWIRNARSFREIDAECAKRAESALGTLTDIERMYVTTRVEAAIFSAMTRQGLGHRYDECAPWRVLDPHRGADELHMLRLLGRRRCGQPLGPSNSRRLDSFLFLLERARLVVAYCPALDEGFTYVPDSWRTPHHEDIPICSPSLSLDEIEWIRDHGL